MADKVSIVILNYNGWQMTHNLLFDLYKHCASIDEVLVVNNGCTEEESFTGLQWWMDKPMLPVRELRIDKNVGFLLAANAGMREATGDIIILISNDVRIRGDIVLRIRHLIKEHAKTMIGGRFLGFDTGWNNFDGTIVPYLEGWLLAGSRDMWGELNYFDERYAPNDFEDIDISCTARGLGYILIALPEDIAQHLSGQTLQYNPEREELTKINREKFIEKWITKSSKKG